MASKNHEGTLEELSVSMGHCEVFLAFKNKHTGTASYFFLFFISGDRITTTRGGYRLTFIFQRIVTQ